ncbi:MAG: hypothetical protein LAT51_11200, partial [Flavobacteriaceae bacterium]|nr:hypothetical protein [Flavobacteriaceae bacterium]
MLKFHLSLFFLFSLTFSVVSQEQEFELHTQFNGSYDFIMIGNTMNVGENTFPFTCQALTESSATLNLEPDQEVVGAYLYWSGSGDVNNPEYYTAEINGTEFEADLEYNLFFSSTNFSDIPIFGGFVDVTEFIIDNGNIEYEFSGIDINQDLIDLPDLCNSQFNYLGWGILIIYEETELEPVQLNIYNGFLAVGNENQEIDFELTNLNVTETSGSSIGFIAWEGDDFIAVDETLQVNNVILGNLPLNPPDNIFNNTNSWTGSDELWNMDLDFFELDDDILEVGDTSIDIKVTSGQDGIILHNFVTRISTELPDATVEITNLLGEEICDNREVNVDFTVFNANATSTLPTNVPVSFFIIDENGDEVFLFTEFTTNPILIGESEDFSFTLDIEETIPENTQLIARVNTDEFGNNPIQENNLENNEFIYELNLLVSPEPLQTQNLTLCANLTESFFNLEEALDETEEIEDEVSFHFTFEDAEEDENQIPNPEEYNPSELEETIFVRRFDGNCFAVSEFEIETRIPPQINDPEIFSECDFSEEQLGFTEFDLDTKIDEITGGNPDYEVEFFTTQADAEDLEIENGLASPYTNENAFSQTIFVRVTDITNECVSFTELELEINLLPVIADALNIPAIEECDDDENGIETFNLTSLQGNILNGLPLSDHQIQYYETLTDAQNNENEIINPEEFTSGEQEIF